MRNRPTNEQFRKQLKDLVDTLRREISEGVYAQAGKLPPEKLLAARFGLSNNSVRKGLEQLVEEGLIEKVPRVGNRVRQAQAGREPVELTIGCYPAALRSLELTVLLEDIQRQFPWISIRVKTDIGVPEIAENVDVVLIDHFQFWQMVEIGRVSCFEALSSEGAAGVYPQLKELFVHEGRNWLRPIIFSPIVLCYNKAHFRECGLEEPGRQLDMERVDPSRRAVVRQQRAVRLQRSDSGYKPVADLFAAKRRTVRMGAGRPPEGTARHPAAGKHQSLQKHHP